MLVFFYLLDVLPVIFEYRQFDTDKDPYATFRLRATRYDRYDPKSSTLKVNETVHTARYDRYARRSRSSAIWRSRALLDFWSV
jgi:hypothetical protein